MRFRCLLHHRRALAIGFLSLVPAAGCAPQDAPRVSLSEFQEFRWLIGVWRGSGGAYEAFFEEYRLVNDSTIQMRAFTDSTRRTVSDSSTIAWRNGVVESRSARSVYLATEVTPTSIRFVRQDGPRRGHTFTRASANEWTATLDPPSPGGSPTVYVMRLIEP